MQAINQALSDYKTNLRPQGRQDKSMTLQPAKPTPNDVCPKCGGFGFFRRDVPHDHPDFGKPIRCDGEAHQVDQMKRLSSLSDLTDYEREKRLSNIAVNDGNRGVITAAQSMLDDPYGWLYIHGGPGNAKGDVLISLVNEFALRGKTALYIKFSRLVNIMRDAKMERRAEASHIEKNGSRDSYENLGYISLFNRVRSVYCLAIDEVDKVNMTGFAEEFRFDFFDERYRLALSGEAITIFASQTTPDEMPMPLTSRFYDGRNRVVENTQPDARPAMKRGQ